MEELYKALLTQLSKIITLAYIDYDLGQLEFPGEFEGCPMPWCLIGFENANWQDIGEKVQDGDIIIKLRIAQEPLEGTSNIVPETFRNKGIEIIRLYSDIFKNLQSFSGTNFNSLTRISENEETREDGIKSHIIRFKTNLRDFSAQDVLEDHTIDNIDITVELQ